MSDLVSKLPPMQWPASAEPADHNSTQSGVLPAAPGSAPRRLPVPAKRNRRRGWWVVNPRFQWKYTAIATMLVLTLVGGMGWQLLQAQAAMSRLLALGDDALLYQEVVQTDAAWQIGFGVLLLAATAAMLLLCLSITHRMCGPLYVAERYLRVLQQGKLPLLRPLRRGDEWQGLVSALGQTVEALHEQYEESLRAVEAAIEAAQQQQNTDTGAALQAALTALQEQRVQLKAQLTRCDAA